MSGYQVFDIFKWVGGNVMIKGWHEGELFGDGILPYRECSDGYVNRHM